MILKEILPRFYAGSLDNRSQLWDAKIDWDNHLSIENLIAQYDKEIERCLGDVDSMITTTTNFCNDILEIKKESFGPLESVFMFLHFQASTNLINILEIRKVLTYEFDWIANSVSQEISTSEQRDFEPNWLIIYITNSNEYIRKYLNETFTLWTRNLFYYSRATGGHKELIEFYFVNCYGFLKSLMNAGFFYLDLIISFTQILAWANKNRIDTIRKETSEILFSYYNLNGIPDEWRKIIAFQFSCDGFQFTNITRSKWCDIVLTYGPLLGHENLHLLLNKYSANETELIENFDKIESAIVEYHFFLESNGLKDKYLNYELSRIFTLLEPAIITLLKGAKVSYINKLIGMFFKISQDDLIDNNNLIILPNSEVGVSYCIENKNISVGKDPFNFIVEITNLLNAFLSKTLTLDDHFAFRASPLIRPGGIPKPDTGKELEEILVEYYDLKNANVVKIIEGRSGYFLYSGHQTPLQPLFVKYVGSSPPIIHSFLKPLSSREIKTVLVWQGDTMLSERECDAISKIFEDRGILMKKLNFHNSTKEEFLENYYKQDFDLIWISCHGQFNSYSPHESYLVLRQKFDAVDEIILTYEELNTRAFTDKANRRLLVLNACDGATTSLNNNPTSIGLGATVINKSQSLISHHWPAETNASLVHGVLLAIYLLEGNSYLKTYEKTIKKYLEGKEAILDFFRVNNLADEVIDGFQASSIDVSSFYYWGSLSYLE